VRDVDKLFTAWFSRISHRCQCHVSLFKHSVAILLGFSSRLHYIHRVTVT